jgi:hypothetical protein
MSSLYCTGRLVGGGDGLFQLFSSAKCKQDACGQKILLSVGSGPFLLCQSSGRLKKKQSTTGYISHPCNLLLIFALSKKIKKAKLGQKLFKKYTFPIIT